MHKLKSIVLTRTKPSDSRNGLNRFHYSMGFLILEAAIAKLLIDFIASNLHLRRITVSSREENGSNQAISTFQRVAQFIHA